MVVWVIECDKHISYFIFFFSLSSPKCVYKMNITYTLIFRHRQISLSIAFTFLWCFSIVWLIVWTKSWCNQAKFYCYQNSEIFWKVDKVFLILKLFLITFWSSDFSHFLFLIFFFRIWTLLDSDFIKKFKIDYTSPLVQYCIIFILS